MSKIMKELVKATGVEQKKGEDRQEFLGRLAKATADLDKKAWEALSEEAQDWYNDNADARIKAKKAGDKMPDYQDFKDAEPEAEEEQPARRRRASEEEEQPAKAKAADKGEPMAVEKLEEGQRVKLTTKRGKEISGEVAENSKRKEFIVVKTADGKEEEVDYDRVESVEVFHGTAGKEEAKGSKGEPDAGPAEPAIGDEVELINKRDKVYKGTIAELSEDEIVIETDDGPEDFSMDRVKSIKVLKKAKASGAAKKEEEPAKGKGKKDEEPAADEKAPRSRSTDGVPIGTRIKQAIAENLDADVKEIGAILKKAGVEVKENTLALNFSECHKLLKELHERDLLSVKKFKPQV